MRLMNREECRNSCMVRVVQMYVLLGGRDLLSLLAAGHSIKKDRCRDRFQGVMCAPRILSQQQRDSSVARAGIQCHLCG